MIEADQSEMSRRKPTTDRSPLRMLGIALRVWAVGFVLAIRGTAWLARKTVRSWSRSRRSNSDETLIG